ncbi:MAG: hypothetical protein R3E10_10020 [Gemmatimonadota bacterium]
MPTYREILPIKQKVESDFLGRPGVTGVDVGTKIKDGKDTGVPSIIVYVAEKKDVPVKQRIPAEVDGVPTDVIQLTFKPTPAMQLLTEFSSQVDATRYATLKGGMSIGPCRSLFLQPPEVPVAGNYVFVGTLGCIVEDIATGDPMMLTNFHVAALDNGWTVGDTIAQPGLPDGGMCPADVSGTLARAVIAGTTAGGAPGVDGAVVRIAGRPRECSILDIGNVAGTATATQGMNVRKRGRTTELSNGVVQSVNATVVVPYGDGIGDVTLQNQILIRGTPQPNGVFGLGGDSGSVVVNGNREIVGLYFAGNDAAPGMPEGVIGVANPIQAVLDALNVRICVPKAKDKLEKFEKIELKFEGKHEIKEILEKSRLKDFKDHIKELHKELKKEWKEPKEIFEGGPKEIFENDPKGIVEDKPFDGPDFPGGPIGPGPIGRGSDIEARLAALEQALSLGGVGAHAGGKQPAQELKAPKEKPEKVEIKEWKEKPEKLEKLEKIEKIEKREKPEKLEKPERKELKDIRKEVKEWKEPKELKEWKEPKETKELKKEWKEPKEIFEGGPKEIFENDPKGIVEDKLTDKGGEVPGNPGGPGAGRSGIEERLARLEAALGGMSHFIGQELRPDLSTGALRQEPDAELVRRSQALQKEAGDAKRTKDHKDHVEKLSER